MAKTNQSTIQMMLSIFNECYPGKMRITERTESIWLNMLQDMDADALMAATNHLCSTRPDWPPDIATVRGAVCDFNQGYLETPTGHEAWEKVQAKLNESEHAENSKVEFTKLEKRVLEATSPIYHLRRSTNPSVDRAQFIKTFDIMIAKKRLERITLPEVKQLVESRSPQLPAPNNKSLDKTNDKGAVCKPEEVEEMLSETPNPVELRAMFKGAGLLDD